ncbi:hypothetical protein JCM19000A_25710 [Silvimonas sp. JCM 19000]
MQAREKAGGVMDTQMLWLEADELRRLVGYKNKSRLCRWLDANRVPFLLNSMGFPLVSRKAIENAMCGLPLTTDEHAKETPRQINVGQLSLVASRNKKS